MLIRFKVVETDRSAILFPPDFHFEQTVHPDLERAMAKRMGATTYELDSSHVPMLSQLERVLDVILAAANA